MKNKRRLMMQMLFCMIFILAENNFAQQNEYLNGMDTNQVTTVSNYTPKINEIVTIQVKYYVNTKVPKGYMTIHLNYDENDVNNKNLEVLSKEMIMTNDAGREVEMITMKVKFNKVSIYRFYTFYHHNAPTLRIPIYVEGRLPQSDPLKIIRDRIKELKQNIIKLEALPASGKARLVSNQGIEYTEPRFNPRTDYEMSIYKDIVGNNKLKYDGYKKEFDRLYTIQSLLYVEWKQKRDIVPARHNSARQNDYLNGIDTNLVITASNYAPKLHEMIAIRVKLYKTSDIPKGYISLDLLYDRDEFRNRDYVITSIQRTTINEAGKEVDMVIMLVWFNRASIFYFTAHYHPDAPGLKIPIYVEGRLPQSDPLRIIRDRIKELKQNIKKLEALPPAGKARLVSSRGLEYTNPKYNPKTDYEISIYTDIVVNNKLKYDYYKKEFDNLYAVQNDLYAKWRETSYWQKK